MVCRLEQARIRAVISLSIVCLLGVMHNYYSSQLFWKKCGMEMHVPMFKIVGLKL